MIEETARLRVRPLVESDLTAYCRILSHPVMDTVNGAPVDLNPELLAMTFEKDRHSPFAFAIVTHSQRLIGAIIFYAHPETEASTVSQYDLGYFLEPKLWGRGLMPEALTASLVLSSRLDGAAKIVWATCLVSNQRSQRVLTKLGFDQVATNQVRRGLPTRVNRYRLVVEAQGMPNDLNK